MKRMELKSVFSITIATIMMASTIVFTPLGVNEVQAETQQIKNINLNTVGIANPTSTAATASKWEGSKVYYAGKECYVLDKDGNLNGKSSDTSNGGNVLLLTQNLLNKNQKFDSESCDWTTSEIREKLNNTSLSEDEGGFIGTMSAIEQASLTGLNISKTNTTNNGYDVFPSGSTTDNIFLLDNDDVNNSSYGFASNATRVTNSVWWLRSPAVKGDDALIVFPTGIIWLLGGVVTNDSTRDPVYPRPAFNVNLNSVLFTSANTASKSSFTAVTTDQVVNNTWKFTLKDTTKNISVTSNNSVTQSDTTVTVPYTYSGNNVDQISIMITDKEYDTSDASILYYGKLDTTLATSGTGTFTLPSDLPERYHIYMMAEDVNDETSTDYSSTPVEINPVIPNDVTNNNPTNDPTNDPTNVKTGDNSQITLWISLLLGSGLISLGYIVLIKKRKMN